MVKRKLNYWTSHTIKFKSMNKSSEKVFETIGKKGNLLCHSGCEVQKGTYFTFVYLFGENTKGQLISIQGRNPCNISFVFCEKR